VTWTSALLLLIAAATMGYDFTPHPWATFASLQGLLISVLLWRERGVRFKAHWWLCIWGVWEFGQVAVCQGLQNLARPQLERFHGVCEAFFPGLTYARGLGVAALIAGLIASEVTNGHRSPNR
jgi:hypothetical protein